MVTNSTISHTLEKFYENANFSFFYLFMLPISPALIIMFIFLMSKHILQINIENTYKENITVLNYYMFTH